MCVSNRECYLRLHVGVLSCSFFLPITKKKKTTAMLGWRYSFPGEGRERFGLTLGLRRAVNTPNPLKGTQPLNTGIAERSGWYSWRRGKGTLSRR